MTPYEYLQQKGIKKIHQPWKRYNFSIEELVSFLTEYSTRKNISLKEVYEGLSNTSSDNLNINYSNKIHNK
jgi:hypothetical protein